MFAILRHFDRKVSKFIEKLDLRLVKKGVNATRLARVVGSPRSLPLPFNAKQWTLLGQKLMVMSQKI